MSRDAIVAPKDDLVTATELVRRSLGPGDVVLIKGRMSQKLARVALALEGRTVRCRIQCCDVSQPTCGVCPMPERGWQDTRHG